MSGYRQFQLEVQEDARFLKRVEIAGVLTIGGIEFPGTFVADASALADRVAVLESASGIGSEGTQQLASRLSTLESSAGSMTGWAGQLEATEAQHYSETNARLLVIESDMPANQNAMGNEMNRLENMIGVVGTELGDRTDALTARMNTAEESMGSLFTSQGSAMNALSGRVTSLESKVPSTVADLASLTSRVGSLESAPASATPASVTAVAGLVSALGTRVTTLEGKPLIGATKAVFPAKATLTLLNVLVSRLDAVTDALVAAGLARYQ